MTPQLSVPRARLLARVLVSALLLASGLITSTMIAARTAAPTAALPVTAAEPAVVHSCAQRPRSGFATCFAVRRTDVGTGPAGFTPQARLATTTSTATPSGYGPGSLQAAYNVKLASAVGGMGNRIYVVDAYDDPNAASDLATYRSQYGLPPCTVASGCFQKLNQAGAPSSLPGSDTGWAGEISLDLDMVSAICPLCAITLIEADDSSDLNLFKAVREAAALGAKFVSMSWGGPESSSDLTWDTYFATSGVVYTASTGDSGFQAGISYPASSPFVVAVGGTSLTMASNARGWTEKVWKTSSTQGTGSGCSGDEGRPNWQGVVPKTTCTRRANTDVSAVADPATGVAVYQTFGGNGWTIYGGTSAAAPIIAGVYALAGAPRPTDRPASVPYAHAGALFDVTTGNNGSCSPALLCTAATGWDGPTGLGTPNGTTAFTPGTAASRALTCTGQKLANPGFESGTSSWAGSSGVVKTDAKYSRSGSGYAWLDGYGIAHTDYIAQTITLPAGCAPTLTYYLWISSQDGTSAPDDKIALTVNGTKVQGFTNLCQGSGYVKHSVSLWAYAGSTVTIKWTGTEDSSLATSFFIDDATLTLG